MAKKKAARAAELTTIEKVNAELVAIGDDLPALRNHCLTGNDHPGRAQVREIRSPAGLRRTSRFGSWSKFARAGRRCTNVSRHRPQQGSPTSWPL